MIQQNFKRNLLLCLEFILKNYEIQVYCEKNHNIYKKTGAAMEECRKAGERSETKRQRALELRFAKGISPENKKKRF